MIKQYIYIKVKSSNKNKILLRLNKNNINIYDISNDLEYVYLKILKNDFEKVKKILIIYEVEFYKNSGILLIKKYLTLRVILMILIFLLIINTMSNTIINVKVITDDKNIRNTLISELEDYGIHKFSHKKTYQELESIKEEIMNKHSDILWMEFESIGMNLKVNVEERITSNIEKEDKYCNIIASKSGIITDIYATRGELVVKTGDYVSAGDLLIRGSIYYNDVIVNNVCAKGSVKASAFYKSNVEIDMNYTLTKRTGKKRLNLGINEEKIFKSRLQNYEGEKTLLFNFLGIEVYKIVEYEIETIKGIYTEEEALEKALQLSKEKILLNNPDILINTQKVLKNTLNDSIMSVEIFYEVEEDISLLQEYSITVE